MSNKVKVNLYNEEREFDVDTTLLEIAKQYQSREEYDIVLAIVNGQLSELHKTLRMDSAVRFITTKHQHGLLTYRRSVPLLMLKAFQDVLGNGNRGRISVKNSVSKGNYFQYTGSQPLTQDLLDKVKERMLQIVKEDHPIKKYSINTEEAVKIFKKRGMHDKERLFKFRRVSRMNLYELDGYIDYYFSYLVPSTGYLKYFDLYLYDEGFVLQMPTIEDPKMVQEFWPQEKLFNVFKESNKWGKMMDIETVGDLNELISKGKINDIILVQEALQEKKIAEISQMISSKNKKFVMIAGPSSSGKTTFAHRLSIQARAIGLKPHLISADDYFLDRENSPRDEFGNYNYEVLEALDIEQFNHDMSALYDGQKVQMPYYNFITGKREYKGRYLQLNEDDIVIVEGIHCLNDKFSHSISADDKFKIYISALTQLNLDEHNRIPTTDGRLIRRLVRDARTRGVDAKGTIERWLSVRSGEESFIFPYQEQADVMFNSALIYELSILKQYAEPYLFNVQADCEQYVEAKRLLKFLDFFLGVSSEIIPKNSLLREFIGDSCF